MSEPAYKCECIVTPEWGPCGAPAKLYTGANGVSCDPDPIAFCDECVRKYYPRLVTEYVGRPGVQIIE